MRNYAIATAAAALVATLLPSGLQAQNAVDALNVTPYSLRGTARFMGMAGAFTALGGDLSTLNQNPAGIGVYRGSDIGFTLNINCMSSKTTGDRGFMGATSDNTRVDFNNGGYVGTYNIGDEVLQTFSWGFSYSRLTSFDRQYRGAAMPLETSLTNYITTFTDGVDPSDMTFEGNYNPYQNYSNNAPDWLSILAYNSGMINPVLNDAGKPTDEYNGLWQYQNGSIPSTTGTADFRVREKGYMDEYTFNFGGNLANIIYWGLGVGVTDMDFQQYAYYGESLSGANVPNPSGVGIQEGTADFGLYNYRRISGTGVNVKFGLIFKPVQELRIGAAIHSPTYYDLTTDYNASTSTSYSGGFKVADQETDFASYDWKLRTPWKFMVGAAGVIGGRGILSVDYEYQAYPDMKTLDDTGDEYITFTDDIKTYTKASNTVRIGGELRVTPSFSIRAGYSYTDANTTDEVRNDKVEVITSGCNTAYTLDQNIQYATFGLGYRYKGFYADAAYVYKHRASKYNAFTPFKDYDGYWTLPPTCKVTDSNSQIVLTLGYKF